MLNHTKDVFVLSK